MAGDSEIAAPWGDSEIAAPWARTRKSRFLGMGIASADDEERIH
jgi:hypothetical protein